MKWRRRINSAVAFEHDPWTRVRVGLAILSMVMVVGVVGYWLLGLSLFDAFYQTAITVTTVGYEEIGTVDQIDRPYRIFTLVLVFFGVSGALYTLGVMVEAFVEGSLNDGYRLRKDQRMIDKLSDHIIIVGAGRVGRSISHYVGRHGAAQVIIDKEEPADAEFPTIVGDATDDDVLRRAGVERASVLIAALNTDAANVYVTLSARALQPSLFIVARTNDQSSEVKFFQAGADRVVNPHEIGGSRMGAIAMHPTLAEFLDEVLHDDAHKVRVSEIEVGDAAALIGRPVAESTADLEEPPLLLAVRHSDHRYVTNPPPSTLLARGDVLIALGSPEQIAAVRSRCG